MGCTHVGGDGISEIGRRLDAADQATLARSVETGQSEAVVPAPRVTPPGKDSHHEAIEGVLALDPTENGPQGTASCQAGGAANRNGQARRTVTGRVDISRVAGSLWSFRWAVPASYASAGAGEGRVANEGVAASTVGRDGADDEGSAIDVRRHTLVSVGTSASMAPSKAPLSRLSNETCPCIDSIASKTSQGSDYFPASGLQEQPDR